MKQSAGTLLYREGESGLEVLIVHPSGNYNRKSPWSIPKGLVDDGEDFESTARRETLEETGVAAEELVAIGSIDYTRSRKRIHCFVGPAPSNAEPRCASWEVDRAEFVVIETARQLLHPDQQPFLDRIEQQLSV
jgi:predicted NUDIX family NTP pyrophosphohydrolase